MKRVAFHTFGCRLNQYDTEAIRTLFEESGRWRSVPWSDEAEAYVVNTCSVTARADASARKAIRRLHEQRGGAKIIVTGCYAQRAPKEIAALPGVSLVMGAANRAQIVGEAESVEPAEARLAVPPVSEATRFLDVPITEMMDHSRAFVKVQEGCNEECTFCIVPQTRGRSRSRSARSVLDQVRQLVDGGYVEVVISGVHVGDYGLDLSSQRIGLPELLRRILEIPGLLRLRLSSIEPASVTEELIDLMAGESCFARHFHIPLQSGSDSILSRMHRRYRSEHIRLLIRRIAERIPECGIGTDVICGFPGESDVDFQRTFDLLEDLPITYLHPFTYSVRPGSAAESFGDQVSGEVKKRRVQSLKRLFKEKSRAFRERHVGRVMPVVVEASRSRGATCLSGWTDNYLKVNLGAGEAGPPIEQVRIEGLNERGELTGRRLRDDEDAPLDGADLRRPFASCSHSSNA